MSLYRNSKFFSSGSVLVSFIFLVLGIASIGLTHISSVSLAYSETNVYWVPSQMLYAVIIIGLAGMGKAALNFSEESEFTWERGKQIAIFIFMGSGILLLGMLLSILRTWIDSDILLYLGDIGLIISCIAYAIGFFFFQRQLASLYLKRVIVKYPKYFISIGFGVQALAYTLFSTHWFISSESVIAIIQFIGIVIAAISILLLIVGFIPTNIAFRAYPHLVEDEEIRPG